MSSRRDMTSHHRESGMLQILRYSPNLVIGVTTAQNVYIKSNLFYADFIYLHDGAPCCQRVVILFASQPACARVLLDNLSKLMQTSRWSRCCLKGFQLNSPPIFCLFGPFRWRVASAAMPLVHKIHEKKGICKVTAVPFDLNGWIGFVERRLYAVQISVCSENDPRRRVCWNVYDFNKVRGCPQYKSARLPLRFTAASEMFLAGASILREGAEQKPAHESQCRIHLLNKTRFF